MDNEIISFNLARIERGREKLCKCDPPHYEVDTVKQDRKLSGLRCYSRSF